MYVNMGKSTSINLRITPDFRAQIEILAKYHGLTMSSLAHSLLVKAVRREEEELGIIASQREHIVNETSHRPLAPVVATITPPAGAFAFV